MNNELCDKEKNINNLKILLANEATKILHGEQESKKAEKTANDTFISKSHGAGLPVIKLDFKDIKNGINILDLLSKNNITHSKSEARRLILNSGLKINNELLSDEKKNIKEIDFKEKILKISLGKKKHYLFKIN